MPFTTAVDIDAPTHVVWGVMTELERWPEWTRSMTRVERLEPGPLAAGLRVKIRQPRLPATVWRVTEVEEGRAFTWAAVSPGARVLAHHRVERRGDGGSRVVLSLEHHGWLGRLVGRLTRGITERYVGWEAEGLKARSEEMAAAS